MRSAIFGLCWGMFALTNGYAADIDFNRDIRPILSNSCFQCHGPDDGQREADLRLDTREGLFRSVDGTTVTAPRQLESSELWKRITSDDDSLLMPPPDSGRSLSKAERELIRQWISEGAEWKGHWAYLPVKTEQIEPRPLGHQVIDELVHNKLTVQGLKPNPPANRQTLIRRLSLDLTGLPPTPEEVSAFLADDSETAYQSLLNRLLDSPRFGERMAMHWLDLVRYADTNGIHGDNHRDIWLYRDYVIDAFNTNKPFDQFTREQLAGDLMDGRTNETLVASGYNRLLMTTREGGAQPKEYLAKYSADRVRNVSTVWLGATIACAECHDHKYDPYSARDFYRLASFFADVQEVAVGAQPGTPIPSQQQQADLERIAARRTELQRQINGESAELTAAQEAWEKEMRQRIETSPRLWTVATPSSVTSRNGTQFQQLEDQSYLTTGPNPDKDTYTVILPIGDQTISGIRLEALTHKSLTNGSLSRANGNFVLNRVIVRVETDESEPQRVILDQAQASFAQTGFPVKNAIDDKPTTGWAVDGHNQKTDRTAVFRFSKPVAAPEGRLVVELHHESQYAKHNIGRFRLSVTSDDNPSLQDSILADDLIVILGKPAEDRSAAEAKQLRTKFRNECPQLAEQRSELKSLEDREKSIRSQIPKTLVTTAVKPRDIRVLPRGNWLDDSGDIVLPGVPTFLSQIEIDGRASRLELANWLVDPQNPLTARVFVNRLWKLMYGNGIVRTPDDFGSQGAWPTHPELLDWLAAEFVRSGWDVKHMLRLMALSKTYRQSSQSSPEMLEKDPFNQWLARQSTYRLDAEVIRDSALLASGLLVEQVGGPSVKPYQPQGYWAHLNFPKRTWKQDTGESLYRRGLYTYWCRTFLHPSMLAFDAPTREECTVQRSRSNNPLQALVLLNDPTYVEASRILAQRAIAFAEAKQTAQPTDEVILAEMFRRVLNRLPSEAEAATLLTMAGQHREHFATHPNEASQLLSVGEKPSDKSISNDRLAAWTSVARVLFNLHESMTRS